MKLKKEFVTHQNDNEHVTVATGNAAFTGMLLSNETAGFIIEHLKTETTEEKIVDDMFAEYEAPREVIAGDVHKIIEKLRSVGAIEE